MVQRCELARHLVGLGVADGHGGDQTDMGGQCREGREDGQRLETVEVVRAGFRVDMQAVGDEHEVELGGFGQCGLLLVEAKIRAGIRLGLRVAPFAPAVADTVDHGPEFKLTWLAHVLLL
jgi:hypothetical protein